MTLKRLIVIALVVWFVLVAVSFVFFAVGGSEPGNGRGETTERPVNP